MLSSNTFESLYSDEKLKDLNLAVDLRGKEANLVTILAVVRVGTPQIDGHKLLLVHQK